MVLLLTDLTIEETINIWYMFMLDKTFYCVLCSDVKVPPCSRLIFERTGPLLDFNKYSLPSKTDVVIKIRSDNPLILGENLGKLMKNHLIA